MLMHGQDQMSLETDTGPKEEGHDMVLLILVYNVTNLIYFCLYLHFNWNSRWLKMMIDFWKLDSLHRI